MTHQPSGRPKQYAVRVEIYGREALGFPDAGGQNA